MSVNVAAQQLTDVAFVDIVLAALRDSGLPPDRLTLEITESTNLRDVEAGVAALERLRRHGVSVAIDDFGTGDNSLSSLSRLPVDVLKVDKSFIDRVGRDASDTSLVQAIIAMSSALGLTLVAEGVEQAAQADWLQANGSALAQGFLWSHPVAMDAALELLRTGVPPARPPSRLSLLRVAPPEERSA